MRFKIGGAGYIGHTLVELLTEGQKPLSLIISQMGMKRLCLA